MNRNETITLVPPETLPPTTGAFALEKDRWQALRRRDPNADGHFFSRSALRGFIVIHLAQREPRNQPMLRSTTPVKLPRRRAFAPAGGVALIFPRARCVRRSS